jgi:transglutaminase-like putative cysteine protease
MFVEIEHTLSLAYDAYIRESFLELRMQPKTTGDQTLQSFVLAVGPPTKTSRYRDWNHNVVHHFTIVHFHDRIEVVARSAVSTHPTAPALAAVTDARPYPDPPYPLLDFLAAGAGVCQDFTHLMLGLLRLRQIPCRYVSGYLHMPPREGETAQSHAWVEFYSPTAGWVPFDPTHNREIDGHYVVVGHGRHYDDVPPNKGIFRGNADETLRTEVRTQESTPKDISALHEEMEQIDVPVYQEIPERRRDRLRLAAEEIAAQQQQEQ